MHQRIWDCKNRRIVLLGFSGHLMAIMPLNRFQMVRQDGRPGIPVSCWSFLPSILPNLKENICTKVTRKPPLCSHCACCTIPCGIRHYCQHYPFWMGYSPLLPKLLGISLWFLTPHLWWLVFGLLWGGLYCFPKVSTPHHSAPLHCPSCSGIS